jgi:hypothetical protein
MDKKLLAKWWFEYLGKKGVTMIEDEMEKFMESLDGIPLRLVVKPLVIEEKKRGRSINQMAFKFKLTDNQIRWILRDISEGKHQGGASREILSKAPR